MRDRLPQLTGRISLGDGLAISPGAAVGDLFDELPQLGRIDVPGQVGHRIVAGRGAA